MFYNEAVKSIGTGKFIIFRVEYERSLNAVKRIIKDISNGADINKQEMLKIVNSIMSILKSKNDLFVSLQNLKENVDPIFEHSLKVALLCSVIAKWLHWNIEDTENVVLAGMLHDIGKLKISDAVLNKLDALTESEFNEIKLHTVHGFNMIQNMNIHEDIKQAVLLHHKNTDNSGYPYEINVDSLNNYTKVVAIADVYDAITSKRSYRDKVSPFEVVKIFESELSHKFDTKFLLVFLQHMVCSYLGSKVLLSTGDIAEIVFIENKNLSAPLVKVKNKYIDLNVRKDIRLLRLAN